MIQINSITAQAPKAIMGINGKKEKQKKEKEKKNFDGLNLAMPVSHCEQEWSSYSG